MRTVHKFPLRPTENGWAEVDLPADAKIILVDAQLGNIDINLWAELDPNAARVTRRFQFVPTGVAIGEGLQHVRSFITNSGARVWHVYEARP